MILKVKMTLEINEDWYDVQDAEEFAFFRKLLLDHENLVLHSQEVGDELAKIIKVEIL